MNKTSPLFKKIRDIGPRIFYGFALLFTVVSLLLWFLIYGPHGTDIQIIGFSSIFSWHAHEMIYGYALAVASGFLLVVEKPGEYYSRSSNNLFLINLGSWLVARFAAFSNENIFKILLFFNIIFCFLLFYSVTKRIFKNTKLYQLRVLPYVLFLFLSIEICFYLAETGTMYFNSISLIHMAIYLLVFLIMMIGGRVLPAVVEGNALYFNKKFKIIKSNSTLYKINILLLPIFFILILVSADDKYLQAISIIILVSNFVRIFNIYSPIIWNNFLILGLYVATFYILLGVFLRGFQGYFELMPSLHLHAFAYGGIGIMTATMMSRIIIGFSSGNTKNPDTFINISIGILMVGAFIRVVLPIFDPDSYYIYILLAQVFWIVSFSLLSIKLIPLLLKGRQIEPISPLKKERV